MSRPLKSVNDREYRQYPVFLSGRHTFYSLSLFLLSLLILINACSTNTASSPAVVSDSAHPSITNVAATGEVVYLEGSDGSITARQAKNGMVIWHRAGLPILAKDYIDLVPAEQVLYDAYETTATTSRIEARQNSNGMVIWNKVIPHHLGPGFVAMMVDRGMIYLNTTFPQNHGLLYALRASDGQVRWQYPLLGMPMDAAVYVNNGIVAVLDNPETGSIHILHGNDGSPLLSYICPPPAEWRPAVDATALYIYCEHRPLQAFHITDGTLLWTARNSSQIVNYWRENQGVIYSDTDTMLQAFRTQDGTLLWQTRLPPGTFGPSLQNQLVAVMTSDQVIMVFHADDGTLAWKKSLHSPDLNLTPSSVDTDLDTNGFFLFGSQQTIHVWRSSDGQDVWQPQVVNGRLYLWQFDGTLEVIDIQQGSVLWRSIV